MPRLLSSDPITKKQTWWHDQGDRNYVIETRQDVTDIAELAKAEYNAQNDYRPFAEDGGRLAHRIARVPCSALWHPTERRMRTDQELRDWLNDPVNAIWRTKPGRV
jgi:hypothetical protein